MGSSLKFYLKTIPGERVEADLTLPEEDGAILTGIVTRRDGEPASAAVVLALDGETMQPVGHCQTDAQGLFAIGPLPGGKLYYINVYDGAAPVRVVKIEL